MEENKAVNETETKAVEEVDFAMLTVTNIEGENVVIKIAPNATITLTDNKGKAHKFNAGKESRVKTTDITLMDATQLKNEIRNANSVLYKTTKRYKDEGKDNDAEVVVKLNTMKKRLDDAKAMLAQKYPNEPRQTKANKAQAILKAIKESNLPEDQKAAALAKLEDLIATLNKSAATGKPAADIAKEDATKAPEAVPEAAPEVTARRRH